MAQFKTVTIDKDYDVDFPDSMSEDQINAAAKKLYEERHPPEVKAQPAAAPGVVAPFPSLKDAINQTPIGRGIKGAAKNVADTAIGIPLAIDRAARYISGHAPNPNDMGGAVGKLEDAHRGLARQGTAEKVGAGLSDLAMFAAMPGAATDTLPGAMASNAAMSAAQTGGDPRSMALAATGGAAGYGTGKVLEAGADKIRWDTAKDLVHPKMKAAWEKVGTGVDPAAMERGINRGAQYIKEAGLEGNAGDTARIAAQGMPAMGGATMSKAKEKFMKDLSTEVGKPRSFTNVWSMLMAAGLIPASIAHAGMVGGVEAIAPLILAAKSVLGKYPGKSAKALDELAAMSPRKGGMWAGGLGDLIASDPLGGALQQQEQVK